MRFVLLAAVATAVACSSSGGSGAVAFTTWGEAYIEQQIPPAAVLDGWTLVYSKFLVTLGGISVGEPDAPPTVTLEATKLFDMHAAGEKPVVTFENVAAKAYTRVSYEIRPATSATEAAPGVSAADKELMVSNGYSLYVAATATKGTVVKTYTWGFKTHTLFDQCKGELSGKETDGVVVTSGGRDTVQVTIHGDHLYYDDLQAKEAKVRFDNIAAADVDADGVVTLDELAKVRLTTIPREKGPYGTGSATGINDLRAFVEALSRTIGHYRGEGECIAQAR